MTTEKKIQQQLSKQANYCWKALKDLRQGKLSLKATTQKAKGACDDR